MQSWIIFLIMCKWNKLSTNISWYMRKEYLKCILNFRSFNFLLSLLPSHFRFLFRCTHFIETTTDATIKSKHEEHSNLSNFHWKSLSVYLIHITFMSSDKYRAWVCWFRSHDDFSLQILVVYLFLCLRMCVCVWKLFYSFGSFYCKQFNIPVAI